LEESRDSPWSSVERCGHRALRTAGITGWRANAIISLADRDVAPDIAFFELELIFEIDGYHYHCSHEAFLRDQDRDTELAAIGWQVVRFSASFVKNRPEAFAARVAKTVAERRRSRPRREAA
jgi:very-short-patch-repair endonuclease